jgi:plasmid stability protein
MPDILIRNVPPAVLASLKRQAAARRRSLQQEVLAILEEAASIDALRAERLATRIRADLAATGRRFSNSAALLREDRER